ncbi:MAG: UDP-N-acetylmuramoyl-tripeptide--D-alanyl-D-alanine ligase [Rhodospirillaceae bacterium]|nr:UDP-N-acetylmuramoyl-tripeptide--D-alanyl-D-alanine ligase [Rhodospirillaceae bacterium]
MNNTHQLWTSAEACKATAGDAIGEWVASGVSINTRTLNPGDLFVALSGPKLDGHDFVGKALDMGAVAAAVNYIPQGAEGAHPGSAFLTVKDTQKALEDLAVAARARANNAQVIAITGSVGKTGIKEALATVLSKQGITSASEGSLNNHWGLPLSLARIPRDTNFAVLEMGMNHAGELTPLSQMAKPHVCIITTIQPAHTQHFKSLEDIASAKAEIFNGAESGAIAVLNHDIDQFKQLSEAAKDAGISHIISFGSNENADVHLASFEVGAKSSEVTVVIDGVRIEYRVGIAGRHWVMNSLCVLAGVLAAGGDVTKAAKALSGISAPKGRGERFVVKLDCGNLTLIDESYNASPASMKAAIEVLSATTVANGGRRIAVLGDMLELGNETVPAHRALAHELVGAGIDIVLGVGEAMDNLWGELPEEMKGKLFATSEMAAGFLQQSLHEGDVVMVKGSAGARMSVVVDSIMKLDTSDNSKNVAKNSAKNSEGKINAL